MTVRKLGTTVLSTLINKIYLKNCIKHITFCPFDY
jgi:hypothetical protein